MIAITVGSGGVLVAGVVIPTMRAHRRQEKYKQTELELQELMERPEPDDIPQNITSVKDQISKKTEELGKGDLIMKPNDFVSDLAEMTDAAKIIKTIEEKLKIIAVEKDENAFVKLQACKDGFLFAYISKALPINGGGLDNSPVTINNYDFYAKKAKQIAEKYGYGIVRDDPMNPNLTLVMRNETKAADIPGQDLFDSFHHKGLCEVKNMDDPSVGFAVQETIRAMR